MCKHLQSFLPTSTFLMIVAACLKVSYIQTFNKEKCDAGCRSCIFPVLMIVKNVHGFFKQKTLKSIKLGIIQNNPMFGKIVDAPLAASGGRLVFKHWLVIIMVMTASFSPLSLCTQTHLVAVLHNGFKFFWSRT